MQVNSLSVSGQWNQLSSKNSDACVMRSPPSRSLILVSPHKNGSKNALSIPNSLLTRSRMRGIFSGYLGWILEKIRSSMIKRKKVWESLAALCSFSRNFNASFDVVYLYDQLVKRIFHYLMSNRIKCIQVCVRRETHNEDHFILASTGGIVCLQD